MTTEQLKTEAERVDAETRKLLAEERNLQAHRSLANTEREHKQFQAMVKDAERHNQIAQARIANKKADWYVAGIVCTMTVAVMSATGALFTIWFKVLSSSTAL